MPPPQRIPSLPGATQASKKAFKPPARVSSPASSSGAAPVTNARPRTARDNNTTAAKPSRTNANVTRTVSTTSSRTASAGAQAGPSKKTTAPQSNGNRTTGFTRAGDLEDIDMFSDLDDDSDLELDALDHAITTSKPNSTTRLAAVPIAAAAATKPITARPAKSTTTTIPQNKRKRLARVPSLSSTNSSHSSSPPRAASPIRIHDEDDDDDVFLTTNPHAAATAGGAANIGTETDEIPLLPAPLLTRLLHESFEDKNVKISRDANTLMARYMDIFVREAVARAAEAHVEGKARRKREREKNGDVNMGDEDDDDDGTFLEMADLEEVAGGLVMDF